MHHWLIKKGRGMPLFTTLKHFTMIRGDHYMAIFKNALTFHHIQEPAKLIIYGGNVLIILPASCIKFISGNFFGESMRRLVQRGIFVINKRVVEFGARSIRSMRGKQMKIIEEWHGRAWHE